MKAKNNMFKIALLIILILTLSLSLSSIKTFGELEVQTINQIQNIDTNSDNIIVNKYYLENDFTLSSQKSIIESCSCSPKQYTINLYNSGNVPNVYKISTNLDYVTITEKILRLEPKTSKNIIVYIDNPCNEQSENLEITARSMTGSEKVLSQKLVTRYCTSFAISKDNLTQTSYNPCELQVYKFKIFNTANFKDNYDFTTDKFNDEITFSENPVSVLPQKNKTVIVYFNPNCSIYGNHKIKITAQSKKTPLQADLKILSRINQSYDFFTTINENIQQCNKEYSKYPFTISNMANVKNTYYLELEGPKWAHLSTQKVTLNSFNSTEVKLIIEPWLKEVGEFNVNITIKTELGDLIQEKEIKIKVDDCYTYDLTQQYDGPLLVCADDNQIFFEIKNTGIKVNEYELRLESGILDNISLDENKILIIPNQTKKVFVNLDLNNIKSKEEITLIARTFSETFQDEITQKLSVVPTQECYKTSNTLKSKYVFNKSKESIDFEIKNEGIKKALYFVDIAGFDWVHIENPFVELNPQESKNMTILLSSNNDTKFAKYKPKLEIGEIEQKYYNSKTFTLKLINRTWLQIIKDYFKAEKIIPKTNCSELFNKTICEYKYFEFGDNQKLRVNLSNYFYDPDNDVLTYDIVNSTNNLNVKIDDDIATISSINNWHGVGKIIFLASDSELTAYSDTFYVQVFDQPNNYIRIFIGKNYYYVILLIILLFIMTLFILFNNKKTYDSEKEQEQIIVDIPKESNNNKLKNNKKSKKGSK